jgi:hypothetical protein
LNEREWRVWWSRISHAPKRAKGPQAIIHFGKPTDLSQQSAFYFFTFFAHSCTAAFNLTVNLKAICFNLYANEVLFFSVDFFFYSWFQEI